MGFGVALEADASVNQRAHLILETLVSPRFLPVLEFSPNLPHEVVQAIAQRMWRILHRLDASVDEVFTWATCRTEGATAGVSGFNLEPLSRDFSQCRSGLKLYR